MKHPIATGPARGNPLAHGHFRPVRFERRGKVAWPGASAHGHLASSAKAKAMPAPRRHGGAARPAGPAAITGRARANARAHGVRKELANASR